VRRQRGGDAEAGRGAVLQAALAAADGPARTGSNRPAGRAFRAGADAALPPAFGRGVDLWHADDKGDYDNRGFRFRGHQYTDANGLYRFRTVKPARYTGRTRHYHVKVQAAGSRVLTTQLYFPDEPGNRRDRLFRSELLMKVARASDGEAARFDFVLELR
jgi:hypothetical protein